MIRVIRFTANWCAPCATFAPIFENVQLQFANSGVSFSVVDIDKQPEIARQYGVKAIPTTIIEQRGKVLSQLPGVYSLDSLKSIINETIKKNKLLS